MEEKLSQTIGGGFRHYFEEFRARVHRLAQDVPEDAFWAKPYPYGNSLGHLVLHLAGNLNYYVGAQVAGSGYVRDREREFTASPPPSKEEALRELDGAVAQVLAALDAQRDEDWAKSYSAVGVDDVHDRFNAFLRCAVHFHHHIGQMIYLTKELQRKAGI